MGTSYSISFYYNEPAKVEDTLLIKQEVDSRLQEINQSMSTYQNDSELSVLNAAQTGEWLSVSDALWEVLLAAESVSQMSKGAFDISVGPLVNAWGFGPSFTADKIPATEKIEAMLESKVGIEHLQINKKQALVKKAKAISLDLSAIAKGYAVDELAALLESKGIDNYLIEIGGELKASGQKPAGQNWKVAIEKPVLDHVGLQSAIQSVLKLKDIAIASSGDYRNFFEHNGKVYSHTIDPKTGMPVEHHLASVTVLHESCMMADALATAFMVMGPESALALAELNELAIYMVLRNELDTKASEAGESAYTVMYSKNMKAYLIND